MKFYSTLSDGKISGVNIGAEMTIGEYLEFLPNILDNNPYQRKKVSSSGKTYDLLRADLIKGCVIPPIILGITEQHEAELRPMIERVSKNEDDEKAWDKIKEVVKKAVGDNDVIILDGLQRSLTMKGIEDDYPDHIGEAEYQGFLKNKIRVEFYAGLSKPGILYRMLTLNTGQTPMTFRHQLEILYYDYIDNKDLPEGITVLKETDDARARGERKYKFSDVIDMFYAYTTGSPMPFNRQALVSELRELDFLEDFSDAADRDDMRALLLLYSKLITKAGGLAGEWRAPTEDEGGPTRPFAPNLTSTLSRTQPMTGFGAECKRMLKTGSIENLDELNDMVDQLSFGGEVEGALNEMLIILDQIAKKAKRIGDAQRIYFQLVFRALFQPESDCRFDLSACWLKAQENYELLHA
ncbi:hypothetical protein FIU85_18060 [Roseovarius sp. THAF8]|uniref:hypothetical protein n=1 Tax=Roseovarius sp. THAF8 TaxID=2587846 RepID=UPI00126831CE|nr:hypothetical protein [Roseovarius sp. THAF8]QFT99226.1 hypothetical protein FIU85_18060 [Roseovarius sp. THAF8]